MSRPVYRIPAKVLSLLHARGVTVEQLAARAGTGRAHATQVMANKPGRGHHTRPRLAPLLTAEERALLGWSEDGRLHPSHMERSTPILDTFRRSHAAEQQNPTRHEKH